MKNVWLFIQNEILGMQWLNRLTGSLLAALGLDTKSPVGGSIHFFIYDTIKITVLLFILIFTISYIQTYFPAERSRRILGRFKGIGANIAAALLGTVTPFCSCSSIPIFIGFTSAGLPLGVTLAFLISSPMVDLGSLVLLTSIFGVKIAVLYVIMGLIIAVAGSLLMQKLKLENYVEDLTKQGGACPDFTFNTKRERAADAWESVTYTYKKVFPYLIAGVAVGAFIHNWIPAELVSALLGADNPFGVIIAAAVGVPMYADIFGTIPVAEALLAKGSRLGVVLAFMMSVTTLSLPSLIMLRKAVKPRILIIFTAICTCGIIAVGYFFNVIEKFIM